MQFNFKQKALTEIIGKSKAMYVILFYQLFLISHKVLPPCVAFHYNVQSKKNMIARPPILLLKFLWGSLWSKIIGHTDMETVLTEL